MSDSISDKVLNGAWQSAYALTSIPVGTALVIQNKSSGHVLAFISASAPVSESDGWAMAPGSAVQVTSGESGCWLKGVGPVSIQAG